MPTSLSTLPCDATFVRAVLWTILSNESTMDRSLKERFGSRIADNADVRQQYRDMACPLDWTVADVGRDLGKLVELTRHTSHWTWVTAPERIGNKHGGDCMCRWSLKTCVGVQPLSERGFETSITDQG